ncbi:MAG: ATP-grasp domain-containing protein [Corynebacterium glutamicum]|nr:ATP-grasp domain-containing protein [Corynebacterium glutamicum]
MNILLSSVGRRPYLVNWFKQALIINDIDGLVYAADIDANSPSKSFADSFIIAPRVDNTDYEPWLVETLNEKEVDLAVSINDFELSFWATFKAKNPKLPLVALDLTVQKAVEDKLLMSEIVSNADIKVPRTWLASDVAVDNLPNGDYITKGRFGSGSRGLRFSSLNGLEAAIDSALDEVTAPDGQLANDQEAYRPKDLLIIQENISGVEFGLDVVSDMAGNFETVLVRRKISMRNGETDRAISVSSEPFFELGRTLSKVIPHPGSIDIDIIVDGSGDAYLIDVNPRLGGGYPFSHLASANLPAAYVAWTLGRQPEKQWLQSEVDVVSGKYVETVRIR